MTELFEKELNYDYIEMMEESSKNRNGDLFKIFGGYIETKATEVTIEMATESLRMQVKELEEENKELKKKLGNIKENTERRVLYLYDDVTTEMALKFNKEVDELIDYLDKEKDVFLDIKIRINSAGGEIYSAIDIINRILILKSNDRVKVSSSVGGFCASAALAIALHAGLDIEDSRGALFLAHQAKSQIDYSLASGIYNSLLANDYCSSIILDPVMSILDESSINRINKGEDVYFTLSYDKNKDKIIVKDLIDDFKK